MSYKKIQKALSGLNANIDVEHVKLCDRIKNLERSHKRMLSLIKSDLLIMDSFWDLCASPKKYVVWQEGENQCIVARVLEDMARVTENLRKEIKREVL